MKKILCSISIFALLISQFASTYGYSQKEYLAKEKIMSRSALHKIVKGRSYSKSIDTLIEELSSKPEKLEKLGEKVDEIIYQLESKNSLSIREKQTLVLLQYIYTSTQYKLYIIQEEAQNAIETKIDTIIQEVKNSELSPSDTQKVEEVFIDFQKNLVKDLETSYSDFGDFIQEQTNYKTQGDLEVSYDIDNEILGKHLGEIHLQDYEIVNSFLDSQISGKLEAVIQSSVQSEESFKMEINSLVDYIQKNGGIYVLLEDLEITSSQENEMIQEFVQRAQELAEENKYLDFSDAQTQYFYEMLDNFNSQKLFNDLSKIREKSLFTSYKKVDNKYYIIPSKYACDSAKKMLQVFDPISGDTCSESQYNDVLKTYLSAGEVTLEIGEENTLSLKAYDFENLDTFNLNITFNSQELTALDFKIAPDQAQYPGDEIYLEYEKNNFLNGVFSVKNINSYAELNSQLDRDNTIENMNFQVKVTDEYMIFSSEGELKNNQLSGNITLQEISNTYDDNWDIIGKEISGEFVANFSGTTDYKNSLQSLQSDFYYTHDDEKILEGDFVYNLPEISFNMNVKQDYSNSELVIQFDSKFNKDEKYFYQLDFNSHFIAQDYQYDYDTWEGSYVGEPMKLFQADYSIENGKINGEASIKNFDNQELFHIQTNGNYFGQKGDIKNIITLDESMNINSQIKKARNSSRISGLKMIQSAVEQSYQDNAQYPSYQDFNQQVSQYLYSIPKDEYAGKIIDGCKFGFKYEVGDDQYGIENQTYTLSTCLEKTGNWDDKLMQDGGIDDQRMEIGAGISLLKNQGVFIQQIDNWENFDNTKNDGKPVINYDIIFDYTNNKTNLELFINAFLGENQAAEVKVKNTGSIKYAPQDIQKPQNTAPINEILY